MSNYDEEPWAAFVREIGLEPVETESQASRVAGFAAAERDRLQADKAELVKAIEHALSHDDALKPEYQLPASLSWELREAIKRAKAKGE